MPRVLVSAASTRDAERLAGVSAGEDVDSAAEISRVKRSAIATERRVGKVPF